MFVASLLSFLAALVTIAAFAVDMVFYQHVRDKMENLGVDVKTIVSTGLLLVSLSVVPLHDCFF